MKNIFGSKKEAVEHCANRVAKFWLEFAQDAIRRGLTPAKLSDDGVRLVREEMDRDIYNRFRWCMDSEWIASLAVNLARAALRRGEYPEVYAFFTNPDPRPMIQIAPPHVKTPAESIKFALDWHLSKAETEASRLGNNIIHSNLCLLRNDLEMVMKSLN